MWRYTVDYEAIPRSLWLARPRHRVEDLLPGTGHTDFALGRAAISWLCQAMGWGRGDRFLLPAFTSKKVVTPFIESGLTPEFYAVKQDLSADLDDIEARLKPGVRGGLILHYFGWPQPPHVLKWLMMRNPESGLWVEDLTQALLTASAGTALGMYGDVTLASFRKLIPCPDGSMLAFRSARPTLSSTPVVGSRFWIHRAVRQVMMAMPLLKKIGIVNKAAGALQWKLKQWGGGVGVGRMSRVSRHLIQRFDVQGAVKARRENAIRLATGLREIPGVEPLFADPPPGVVPMVLPVRVRQQDHLRRALAARGIRALHLWPRPPQVEAGRFPVADRLQEELLSLPIDERYGPSDMDVLSANIAEIMAETITEQEHAGIQAAPLSL